MRCTASTRSQYRWTPSDGPSLPPSPACRFATRSPRKLHACSDPLDGQRSNDRARDLADLILLEELLDDDDMADVRSACVDVFTVRNRQPWPPALVAPAHWSALWDAIVDEDHFPVTALDDAVARVRNLVTRIDSAAAH